MRFFITAFTALSGLAATVLAYPTETMDVDGVAVELITDPALIFIDHPTDATTSTMKSRAAAADWPVTCGAVGDLAGYSAANSGAILDGINYLLSPRTCALAAGAITRISCSYSAGIFVMNRETYTVYVECGILALDAVAIRDKCASGGRVIGRRGTTYHSGNTHIRAADC